MHILRRIAWTREASPGWTSGGLAIAGGLVAALGLIAGCSRSSDRAPVSLAPRAGYSSTAATGVSASPRLEPVRLSNGDQRIAKGGGSYKIGKPYTIAGRWYFPQEDPGYDRRGIASWYGADFHGRKTANGEIYDMNALTAAHPTLPIPSFAYVTSLKTGRTVLVRVNDRGPYAKDRIIDLSRRTAEALGVAGAGISDVRVKYAGRAPLDGNDSHERRFLAAQPWAQGERLVASAPTQTRGPEWARRMGVMRAE